MDWSNQLDNIIKVPKTVDESVDRLMTVLDDEHKLIVASMQEDELIDLHFSLGTDIRNSFDLHDKNSPLLKSLGVFVHPDDVAMVVIHSLWAKLTKE